MNRSEKPTAGVYWVVFAALTLLLVATVVADQFNFGAGNLIVAMVIAVAKAGLIAVFFMHLRNSDATLRIAAAASLLWLAVLVTLTMADYATRGWDEPGSGRLVDQQNPETFDRTDWRAGHEDSSDAR